jgi:CBS domain-containing protein
MSAGRIGIRDVDVVEHDQSAWLAAERMHQRCVGALVVLNEKREPIGIVTDRDLLERVVVKRLDPDKTLVRQVMTTNPRTIYDGAPMETALQLMRDGRFRRLPVVDHEGKLCGLICLDDVMMRWAHDVTIVGELLKSETPRGVCEESTCCGCQKDRDP